MPRSNLFAALTCTLVAIPAMAQVVGGPGPAKPRRPANAGTNDSLLQVAFTATIATDYVNRGVSQTGGRPEALGGMELGWRGFYTGTTLFDVDFRHEGNPHTTVEYDLYGGYVAHLGRQGFDFGLIRYGYTPQPVGQPGLDYFEAYGKTARNFGQITLSGSVYYSPAGMSGAGESWYGVGSAAWAIDDKWTASTLLGRQTERVGNDYTDWNAGVTRKLTKALSLDLRYWDTDRHDLGHDYHARAVAALNASF